jgi:type I restriction enzyme, R subunit
MITEDQLEQQCLELFREAGWDVAHGPDIAPDGHAPERADYREVLLSGRLLQALQRLNSHIPAGVLEEAIRGIAKLDHPNPEQRNRDFHRYLLDGVPVQWREGDELKHDHAYLVDFYNPGNNDFLIVNQFAIQGPHRVRRPDIVAFINGLPLAVMELKNPADEHADIWAAWRQIQTYKEGIPDLFNYNAALAISDGFTARLGSLTAGTDRYMPWRTIRDENDRPVVEFEIENLIRGFFDSELLLDYLRYFIIFEQDGDDIIKKIAGYHQFHAVREAVRVTLIASQDSKDIQREDRATYGKEVKPGSRKAGVVWHTQGSGKSISMVCYAGKLLQQPEMKNPTIVVVTDRNNLDGQLYETFCAAQELLKQTPEQAESREELREKLASRQAGGIIFTTVQKFSLLNGEKQHPALCERSNVVVISDEAHRSQYGLKAKLNTKTGEYVYGFAKHMRDALPNASFIGFTGTPISKEDKDTQAVFGSYVSIYDIQDAVEDGATVEIYYESRLAKLDINQEEIERLSREVEELVEEEDEGQRERTKGQWAALEKLVGAEPRLAEVAEDLVKHFEARTAVVEGKGMIVCMSRDICARLYDQIIQLRPDWHSDDIEQGAIKVIMTSSASDYEHLRKHSTTKQQKKRLEKRFKDPKDSLKLVIVRDMWLTGFDAPCCHTMYVDKPMKGHNLMQAIARVNRVFRDKPGGLVVDYIGITGDLKRAFKDYTDSQGRGEPTHKADEALDVLRQKVDVVRGMFATPVDGQVFDYSDYGTRANKLLVPAANHILGLEDGKKRFLDTVTAITRAFSLCGTLDEAAELRQEIAFFSAVRAAIVKYTSVDRKLTEAEKQSALRQILDNAIVAQGVTDIFELAGMDKPNIGLLSEEFLEDVRQMPQKNFAIELLEKLLKDEIRAHTRRNVVQQKKYSERLQESLRKYHNRAIETAQVIEELIQMAQDFQAAMDRHEDLGLNDDEMAFYDALAEKPEVLEQMGNEQLRKLAVELTEKLRQSTTVDWQKRESVRAQIRLLIKRLLRKYKYPPEGHKDAINMVLRQAEELADEWSG